MTGLVVAFLGVLVGDHALKHLLPRLTGTTAVSLGPFGRVQVVAGRLWLRRLWRHPSQLMVWFVWLSAAVVLIIATRWVPTSSLFVGLLLGGSFSNAVEICRRGDVSDYICLRFWPAFNFADVAVAIGAIGTLIEAGIAASSAATGAPS